MSYRDSYNKNDNFRPQHQSKALSTAFDLKPEMLISPRISKKSDSKLYEKIESLKERHTITPKSSHENNPVKVLFGYSRNTSSNMPKTQEKIQRVDDFQEVKKSPRKNLDLLQKELELTKSWKKLGRQDEVKQCKEKLNFLVKKVESFLASSLRFQSMLHEKLGQSVSLVYEEERNLLIEHVKSTTQGFEIVLMNSQMSSPLRSCRSPKLDDNYFYDPESANVLEELKMEKSKTKRLQIELSNELSKKDTEMKNIRDRLIELEIIEKSKFEIEKKFAKASQDWNLARQDLIKENNFFKSECLNYKEKIQELDTSYADIQHENRTIKEKFNEVFQENYKLSESLQTFDRLYNYTKKWVEKSIEESQNNFIACFKDIGMRMEEKELELKIMQNNLEKVLKSKEQLQIDLGLEHENATLAEKNYALEEKLNKILKNYQNNEKILEKINFNYQEAQTELNDKNLLICDLKDKNSSIKKKLAVLSIEYEATYAELIQKKSEIADLIRKIEDLNIQLAAIPKDKDLIEKILLKIEEKNKENTELSNKISQNFNDLDKMQREKKELMGRVSSLILENQEAQTKIHELVQENHSLKSKMQKSSQESENLCIEYKKMQKINEENANLLESIEEKNSQVSNLHKKLEEKEVILLSESIKKQEIDMILKEKDRIIKNLECKILGFEEMDKELNKNIDYIRKLKKIKREKDQTIENLHAKIVENEEKHEEMANRIKETEDKIENLRQIISNKDNNYKELNAKYEKYKEIAEKQEDKDKEHSAIDSINQNNRFLRESIIKNENEIKLLQLKNAELTDKAIKKNLEIEKMKENIEEKQQMIKLKEKSIENFESSLKDQENLVKALNSKDAYISKIVEKVDSLTKLLEDKNSVISSLQIAIKNSENEFKEIEIKLKSLEEIPVLIKEKTKLQESLNNSIKNAEILEKLLKEKGDILRIKDNQIKEIEPLRESNREFNDKVNSLLSENKEINKKTNKLLEEILMKEKQIKELTSENMIIKELSERIIEKDEEINELKARIYQEQKSSQSSTELYETLLKEKADEINRLNKAIEKLMEKIKITVQSSSVETEILTDQVLANQKELETIKSELFSLQQINGKHIKEENNYKNKISSLEKENAIYKSDIENFLKQIASYKQTIAAKAYNHEDLSTKIEEFQKQINDLNKKNQKLISQFEESEIVEKEEIARLNSDLIKQLQINEAHEKEIHILVQKSVTAENAVKSYHCDNCETLKEKVSELECTINLAEESLGGFFTNTLIESIEELVSSKAQNCKNAPFITANNQSSIKSLRRAPRPPVKLSKHELLKRQSEELKSEISDDLFNKYPLGSEGSKRSHSSALSLPEYSDLISELNDEKIESEKYLTQIKMLKEDIRELERKLKRTEDVNDKINAEVLKSALLKMVRSIPIQNSEIEGMIHLVFSIISVPKEEIIKLEPERKAKNTKLFGVF